MYELNQTPFGSRQRFDIFHKVTGTGFSIVPEAGATVISIQFNGKNILDGYETPEESKQANGEKQCAVSFPQPPEQWEIYLERCGIPVPDQQ
jgi:hypothetical protein